MRRAPHKKMVLPLRTVARALVAPFAWATGARHHTTATHATPGRVRCGEEERGASAMRCGEVHRGASSVRCGGVSVQCGAVRCGTSTVRCGAVRVSLEVLTFYGNAMSRFHCHRYYSCSRNWPHCSLEDLRYSIIRAKGWRDRRT